MEQQSVPSVFDELEKEPKRFEYATTGQRFLNYVIDHLGYWCVDYCFTAAPGFFPALGGYSAFLSASLLVNVLLVILFGLTKYLLYYYLMEGITTGRSLGKLVTGTVAVKNDLSPITWKDAMMRTLVRLIPLEPFSGLGGYPWHDQYSKTRVIKKNQAAP